MNCLRPCQQPLAYGRDNIDVCLHPVRLGRRVVLKDELYAGFPASGGKKITLLYGTATKGGKKQLH